MACGLSRSELTSFNISLDDNQRCQAIRPGGGGVCNSLLSEHIQNQNATTQNKPTTDGSDNLLSTEEDGPDTSSCCGRVCNRSLHSVKVVIVTYMVILCFLVMFISGINFYVDKSQISNLMIDSEADALQFWYRTNRIGLSVIEYANSGEGADSSRVVGRRLDEEDEDDDYQEISEMYIYSSISLNDYNCGGDVACDQTVDDLSTAWKTLLVASSVSALLCIISWLLSAPRNFYPCCYNTKVCQTGVREEKKFFKWFVKPSGLTYLLTIMYIVVFGVQFVSFFKYVSQLPSNEDMYTLSLHYLNSDPTLCSVANPCTFAYDSVDTYNRNIAFLVVSVVFAGLAVVFVAATHRLKLKYIRWDCFSGCCTRAHQGMSDRDHSNNPSLVTTEEEVELPAAHSSHGQGQQGQPPASYLRDDCSAPAASSCPPEAVLIGPSEVHMMVPWTEGDELNSKC